MKIFHFFCFILLIFSLFQSGLQAGEFPEIRTKEKDVFPRPEDGQIAEINPPGFTWLPVEEAGSYKLIFKNAETKTIKYEFVVNNRNAFSPKQSFQAGNYEWIIEAYSKSEKLLARRRVYKLTIPEGIPEFPFPNIEELLANISKEHPRLIFGKKDLKDIRATLTTTRKKGWEASKKMADESLNLSPPELPTYGPIENYNHRRIEYRKYYHYIRPFIDEGLQSLSLAWMMTGEEKYAVTAKRILLEVCKWDAKGITSSNNIGFDEPGLSLARCLHRTYDWLYEALNEEEREIVRKSCIDRARDTFQRVGVNRPYLQSPGSSHDARLIGYLCEQALVLYGEAPDEEVKKWLEYSLTAFMTVFPHWGGYDGGWAEGIGYAATYNNKATHWIESCVSTLNLNLWQKPIFQKIPNYFLYCARPNDEFWPYGDGAERGPRSQSSRVKILHMLMSHYAQRFEDSAYQWWADNAYVDETEIEHPVLPIILPKETRAVIPKNIPNAKVFRGVGLCALHSDISDIENDVFLLFKSSPYGSISHSHADQNAFYISVGGRALAIPSGYYGPVYGMPHHADWTRATKANNCILVNNQGQTIRDFTANGKIIDFKHEKKISYVAADATPAYKGLLDSCIRHVIFVRPGLFLMLDDLEAPEESTYQWLLHALEEMDFNESTQSVQSARDIAWLNVRLFNSSGSPMSFSQTNKFDTPFLEGVPEDRFEELSNAENSFIKEVAPHYHFKATTQIAKKRVRIVSIMTAGSGDKEMKIDWLSADGWTGARIQTGHGVAEVWGQLTSGSKIPDAILDKSKKLNENAKTVGIWIPNNGDLLEILTGE
jgi:hypothetical protein